MSKSILQNYKECWVCKTQLGLHKHHIFFGANRKIADKDGCWVWLCGKHHNLSNSGVHYNRQVDISLKQLAQQRWMQKNSKTTKDFIERYGKNYL